MNENQALRQEIAELRLQLAQMQQKISELDQDIGDADAWALGVYLALESALPHLLTDHPKAAKVGDSMKRRADRYYKLERYPERAEEKESKEMYEASKMLYSHCAQMGVWPGVDPEKFEKQLMRQFRRRYNLD